MNKSRPSFVGFLQALGVVGYCALVSGFIRLAARLLEAPPGFLGTVLMLTLFVFSAAVTGAMVFGYPAYLAVRHRTEEGLHVFAFTLLYLVGIIAVIVAIRAAIL